MGNDKDLNIKNQTYYYFDEMIDIRKFKSNLLKTDKKTYKDLNIYYFGYITIKKFVDCENICCVNHLYLLIYSATGYFKEKNSKKYLILDPTEKYEEVFSGIKSEIEMINSGEKIYYEKNYVRIGIKRDDDIPLDKPLKLPLLTIIIRCIFQKAKKLYPQIYLHECLYESV